MRVAGKRRVVLLFPNFPLDHPITGGEKYNAVVIRAALEDPDLQASMLPPKQHMPPWVAQRSPLRRAWYQVACLLAIIARPCDLLVTDASYHSWILLAIQSFRWLRRAPIVAMGHHIRYSVSGRGGLRFWLERWSERALYRCMSYIIPTSHTTQRHYEQEGLRPRAFQVIYPATDVDLPSKQQLAEWRQRRVEQDIMHIIYVGQCDERKGLYYLLEACAMLDFAWQLDIIGKYDPAVSYYQSLNRLVQEHNLGARVRFHGFVSNQELAQAYAQADLFCLPSLHEGFGIVLVEAMGYGLPIVATTAGAIPELVEHGRSGLLVPPADAAALAQALTQIQASPELYGRLADGACARAQDLQRDWTMVADEALACLHQWAKAHESVYS